MSEPNQIRTARVIGAKESLVSIETDGDAIVKNEVGYVELENERLKAEVLRVRGNTADMQVFEDTRGCRSGDAVSLTGEMLSVELGPGILGTVFDGLQNPLQVLADEHGFFLPRGQYPVPLNRETKWTFTPVAAVGDKVAAGQPLGTVPEGILEHKIMVPFGEAEPVEVTWIEKETTRWTNPWPACAEATGMSVRSTSSSAGRSAVRLRS